MVLASKPVASVMRLAARPVGAHSRSLTPLAARIRRMPLTMVVLPTPGPPVMTNTLHTSASRIAADWLSAKLEAELGARRLCDSGARDPQHDAGIVRVGPGDCLPDRCLEAEARRRIKERMDLLAAKPRARSLPVERTATGSHDVPALAQNDLVGLEPAADLGVNRCRQRALELLPRPEPSSARATATRLHVDLRTDA
jgi:hypothetical protein